MEPWKTPPAAHHFHSWLQSFKSTTNTYNNPLPLANSNKDWAVVFTKSNTGSHAVLPTKCSKQSFHANKMFTRKTTPLNKSLNLILSLYTFMSEWQQTKICTQRVWKLVRVNVHLLAVVRLLRSDMVQQAAKVKIYTEQLQLQKLTLDDMGCMINHGGQGALDSRSRKTLWTGLRWGVPIRDPPSMQFRKKIIV